MGKWMALFQIGPVQDFIQTARKVQDYWSGSYLLSYLCKEAMETVGYDRICFPVLPEKEIPGRIPIPNRFMAILDVEEVEEAKEVMKEAEKKANAQWIGIAGDVAKVFKDVTRFDLETGPFQNEWKHQIDSAFEYLWVVHPWDGQDSSYRDTHGDLEQLLGARKATRWFESPMPPGGPPCSLCGRRLAIIKADPASKSPPPRPKVKDDWKVFRTGEFKTRFREGECLCSVCLVKRLAPDYAEAYKKGRPASTDCSDHEPKTSDYTKSHEGRLLVPSTSTLAISGFLKASMNADIQDPLKEGWGRFRGDLENSPIPDIVGEPKKGACLESLKDHPLARIEGDWLIEDIYDRFAGKEEIASDPSAKSKLKALLTSFQENVRCPAKNKLRNDQLPGKYYAVVSFDGDSMGEKLAEITSADDHKSFSKRMTDFAGRAYKIIEIDHAGFLAYAGGDEGLAFVALRDLLPLLEELRKAWQEGVMMKETPPVPTLSAGAVIAHYQQGMGRVIEEAFNALHAAKSFSGKDAFAVTILRRSGAPVTARAPWLLGAEPDAPSMPLSFIEELVEFYQSDKLSPKWWRDLLAMARVLEDPHHTMDSGERSFLIDGTLRELFKDESRRVLARHWSSETNKKEHSEIVASRLVNLRNKLHVYGAEDPFRETMNLMDLAQFIAQGGVR